MHTSLLTSNQAHTVSFVRFARQLLVTCMAVLHLTACSKSVQWEEEVPLNNGQTIWVKRTATYSLQGGAGNPLDVAYRPEPKEGLEFVWAGKRYRYEGDAQIMLLAIGPDQTPVLVARAADKGWNFVHGYECTWPFYVQLVPRADAEGWIWPAQIDPWLYHLPSNLMLSRLSPNKMLSRYTTTQRQAEDAIALAQTRSYRNIDPNYVAGVCRNQKKK